MPGVTQIFDTGLTWRLPAAKAAVTTGPEGGSRIQALDGLRGVAILLVLLIHCFVFSPGGPLANALIYALRSMWLGVDLFFVLSGYLITRILIQSKGSTRFFRDFYLRRAFRIWPAYYLVLAFVFWVYPLFNDALRAAPLQSAAPYLIFQMQNWYIVFNDQWFAWMGVSHFWSLSMEEQFYVLWPLLVAITPLQRLARMCALLFIATMVARAVVLLMHFGWLEVYVGTFTHLDGLVAGAWVAAVTAGGHALDAGQRRWLMRAGMLAFGALIALEVAMRGVAGHSPVAMSVAIALSAVAFAALVHEIHYDRLPELPTRLLTSAPLTWLGRYSYGIYLIHYVIVAQILGSAADLLPPWLRTHPLLQSLILGLIVVGITLVAARLMYEYVEAPALRWSRRFRPSSAAGAVVALRTEAAPRQDD